MYYLKKLVYKLPKKFQFEAKRIYYFLLIKTGKFSCDEIEFRILDRFITPGDWVIDVGANIGHYSTRLSRLVGAGGRVIAFEPFPDTFSLLTSNCHFAEFNNISLINAAASDEFAEVSMELPHSEDGSDNYYQAKISHAGDGQRIFCMPAGIINFSKKITFIKVDAEGHDFKVILGLENIIRRDSPLLVVEEDTVEMRDFLSRLDYHWIKLRGSHNTVFVHTDRQGKFSSTVSDFMT